MTVERFDFGHAIGTQAQRGQWVRWSDYNAMVAQLAQAERAILDLWRGQIRCGYTCNQSANAAHVDGKVWADVAARFQHVINPDSTDLNGL